MCRRVASLCHNGLMPLCTGQAVAEFAITVPEDAGIILCIRPASEGRRYIVTSSLIGWAHTQNDPWRCPSIWRCLAIDSRNTEYLIICVFFKDCLAIISYIFHWPDEWHLAHWGRVTHICVSKLTIIGSGNGLSPGIIWTIAGKLLIEPLGTNFSGILFEYQTFSYKKMHLKNVVWKMAAILSRPRCVKVFDEISRDLPVLGMSMSNNRIHIRKWDREKWSSLYVIDAA